MSKIWNPPCPTQIAVTRSTGRRMEVYRESADGVARGARFIAPSPGASGLWRCRPAPGDPGRKQWVGWDQSVLWPRDWFYLPGDQRQLQFQDNAPAHAPGEKGQTHE